MAYSKRRAFRYFLVTSSLVFSFFSPTLQSLISNSGVWPGLGFYPIDEVSKPEYWFQVTCFLMYAATFYFVTLLIISCEYYSTKISNFILSWVIGTGVFFLTSLLLDYPKIDFHGDLLYRSVAMGFIALMFAEIVLKKLKAWKINPEEILPKYFIWLCEALPILRGN